MDAIQTDLSSSRNVTKLCLVRTRTGCKRADVGESVSNAVPGNHEGCVDTDAWIMQQIARCMVVKSEAAVVVGGDRLRMMYEGRGRWLKLL